MVVSEDWKVPIQSCMDGWLHQAKEYAIAADELTKRGTQSSIPRIVQNTESDGALNKASLESVTRIHLGFDTARTY